MQVPSIGRAVHYVSHGTPVREDGTQVFPPRCRAATVTELADESGSARFWVGLAVLNPSGLFFQSLADGGCPADFTDHRPGTWHWPERTGPDATDSETA